MEVRRHIATLIRLDLLLIQMVKGHATHEVLKIARHLFRSLLIALHRMNGDMRNGPPPGIQVPTPENLTPNKQADLQPVEHNDLYNRERSREQRRLLSKEKVWQPTRLCDSQVDGVLFQKEAADGTKRFARLVRRTDVCQ